MPERSELALAPFLPTKEQRLELCKSLIGVVVAQVMFAKGSLPPSSFQLLPWNDVGSKSFGQLVRSGQPLQSLDKTTLQGHNTVYLRDDDYYHTRRLLGILEWDIFPLVDNGTMNVLCIAYLTDPFRTKACMAEQYALCFERELDGVQCLDLWLAGMTVLHNPGLKLRDLGKSLSRMPLGNPMHWTLAFYSSERPDNLGIGTWRFNHVEYNEAEALLEERLDFCVNQLLHIEIGPQPTETEAKESNHEDALVPRPLRTYKSSATPLVNETTSTHETLNVQELKRGQKRKYSSQPQKSLQRRQSAQSIPQLSEASKLVGDHDRETSNGENAASPASVATPSSASRNENISRANNALPRRKPKPALQIFEDIASDLSETQELAHESLRNDRRNDIEKDIVAENELLEAQTPHPKKGWPPMTSPDFFDSFIEDFDATNLGPEADHSPLRLPPLPEETPGETRSSIAPVDSQMLQASPPANLFGIASEDGDDPEIAQTSHEEPRVVYTIEPNTVALRRQKSMIYDSSLSGSEDDGAQS